MKTTEHLHIFVQRVGTQRDAAKRLGISEGTLSAYLSGKKRPGAKVRERLRDAGYDFPEDGRSWATEDLSANVRVAREIGMRLCEYRELLQTLPGNTGKATREGFAKLLGVSADNIRDYENGVVPMSFVFIMRLFDVGCNLNWLFTGIGQPFFTPQPDAVGELLGRQIPTTPITLKDVKAAAERTADTETERRLSYLEGEVEQIMQYLLHQGRGEITKLQEGINPSKN